MYLDLNINITIHALRGFVDAGSRLLKFDVLREFVGAPAPRWRLGTGKIRANQDLEGKELVDWADTLQSFSTMEVYETV